MQAARILFLRTDRMGDVLMNLPAIRLLRQIFPKAWITLLCDAPVADLFKNHPDIDEVLTIEAAKLRTSFAYRWQLLKKIRHAKFNLAVVSNPDKRLHLLAFMAGIPVRIGYGRKWGFLLTKTMPDRKDAGSRHEMDMNLDLIKTISDKAWDGSLKMAEDAAAKDRVEARLHANGLAGEPIIAVHPGTSNPAKRWALKRFMELCGQIRSDGAFKVVLIGGPEEKETAAEIKRGLGASVTDWTGSLSLAELSAFLGHSHVKALVSSDSGPVHIAWMSGTPVVALYAKNVPGSNPVRWGPRDGVSEVIYKPMNEITTEEVYEGVKRVLLKR